MKQGSFLWMIVGMIAFTALGWVLYDHFHPVPPINPAVQATTDSLHATRKAFQDSMRVRDSALAAEKFSIARLKRRVDSLTTKAGENGTVTAGPTAPATGSASDSSRFWRARSIRADSAVDAQAKLIAELNISDSTNRAGMMSARARLVVAEVLVDSLEAAAKRGRHCALPLCPALILGGVVATDGKLHLGVGVGLSLAGRR